MSLVKKCEEKTQYFSDTRQQRYHFAIKRHTHDDDEMSLSCLVSSSPLRIRYNIYMRKKEPKQNKNLVYKTMLKCLTMMRQRRLNRGFIYTFSICVE